MAKYSVREPVSTRRRTGAFAPQQESNSFCRYGIVTCVLLAGLSGLAVTPAWAAATQSVTSVEIRDSLTIRVSFGKQANIDVLE